MTEAQLAALPNYYDSSRVRADMNIGQSEEAQKLQLAYLQSRRTMRGELMERTDADLATATAQYVNAACEIEGCLLCCVYVMS